MWIDMSIDAAPLVQTGEITSDVSISQTLVAPGPFYPGQEVFYLVYVENVGTSVATSLTVTDVLPSEVQSVTILKFGDPVEVEQISEGPNFAWLIKAMDPGQQVVLYLRGSLDPTLSANVTLTSTAQISNAADINPLNDRSQVSIDVVVPELKFAVSERQIQESDSSIVVSIVGTNAISESLPPSPYTDIYVDYTTVEGSATVSPAPADYVAISGTATISQGLRSASVEIPINDDLIAEGTESFTLELSNPVGAQLGQPAVLQITIDDDESAGVRISPAEINAAEGGDSGQYSIELRSRPSANVTIQLQPDAQIETSVGSVTFTPGNWNQSQMIQVTAIDDDVSEDNHQGIIQHQSSSDDASYNDVIVADLVANIADDDGARIVPSTASLSLVEGEEPARYKIMLGSEPRNPVTVTVVPDEQLLVAPAALYFDAINWSLPQTVTVTAIDDIVREETHIGTLQHEVTSLDPVYNGIFAPGITANIGDNDYSGILLSSQSIDIVEGAPSASENSYSVVLVSQPLEPVTVFIHASENLTATPTQLYFTPQTWAVAQPIMVVAADNDVVGGESSGQIRHSTSSPDRYYDDLNSVVMNVNILDNDVPALRFDRSFPLQVDELGTAVSYGISLASQPTSTVVVALVVNSQLEANPSVVAFEPESWSTVQQIMVSAVDEGVVEGTHSSQIGYSIGSDDSHYDNLPVDPVPVLITEGATGSNFIFLPVAR